MQTHDDIQLADEDQIDDEPASLSVAEMIGYLRAIEHNLADDLCLMDLAPELTALRAELEKRRQLAVQVAAEIDAENCLTLN